MKRILSLMITIVFLFTSASVVFAKSDQAEKFNNQQIKQQEKQKLKAKKQTFKINGSPIIKYGRYKLPISPVTNGMGATVTFDSDTAVLTVVKDTNTIAIDFDEKTVTVNGIADTDSGIFTAKNSKKMTVLIKYIAELFGIRADVDEDQVIVEVPGLNRPANVTVTPVGTNVKPNTLNSTTTYMTATAKITAGQATGGRAELYVGSKLVATDSVISAADTEVNFTTSDNTPTNAELQAAVPAGGIVTVKLYNAAGNNIISSAGNPTLTIDYTAPSITAVKSAVYFLADKKLYITVSGATTVGDAVDVAKISLYDGSLGRSYNLTDHSETGSKGTVISPDLLIINIGSTDKAGLAEFEGMDISLNAAVGSLLTDAAGNASNAFTAIQTVPVTIIQ